MSQCCCLPRKLIPSHCSLSILQYLCCCVEMKTIVSNGRRSLKCSSHMGTRFYTLTTLEALPINQNISGCIFLCIDNTMKENFCWKIFGKTRSHPSPSLLFKNRKENLFPPNKRHREGTLLMWHMSHRCHLPRKLIPKVPIVGPV